MATPSRYTRDQLMQGRDTEYPTTELMETNAAILLYRVNHLLADYGQPVPGINSGYRPGRYNVSAGGALHSAHLTCEAVDLADSDGSLKQWLAANPDMLARHNLYQEAPASTPSWVHLQTRPTTNRVFLP